ncbi:MAG: hypothetical protein ACOX4H_01260 [Bacillota bacterium]
MEIYVFEDQVVFYGKVKELLINLDKLKKEYPTVLDLIKANLP